jgi:hypothetical protein
MIRRIILVTTVTVGIGSLGTAQSPSIFSGGTPVGKPILQSVGTPIPKAAPEVGQKVGTPPGGPSPMATQPKVPFDLSNVVAPIDPAFLPPALRPQQNESLYETAFKKWFDAFGLSKPPEQKNTFTPGIYRRNRERARERQWYRD